MHPSDREDLEIELFIRALQLRYGYDFSQYAPASFKRRVRALREACGARNISALTERLIYEPEFVRDVVARLSVPVSEMFRDPRVFLALRREVLPILSSYPRINIWQAGCARGEEVYSLAIVLAEEGLLDRAQIFATDLNDVVLEKAAEGVYPAREAQVFSRNYAEAGGKASLADYFHARYDLIKMNDELKRNVTFANHNLVADGVFTEVHLILCRNVLIYFNDGLQQHVLELFRNSLVRSGFLCLGSRESLAHTRVAGDFALFNADANIHRLRQA